MPKNMVQAKMFKTSLPQTFFSIPSGLPSLNGFFFQDEYFQAHGKVFFHQTSKCQLEFI